MTLNELTLYVVVVAVILTICVWVLVVKNPTFGDRLVVAMSLLLLAAIIVARVAFQLGFFTIPGITP